MRSPRVRKTLPDADALPRAAVAANDPPPDAPAADGCLIEIGQSAAGPTLLDLGRLMATRLLIQAGSGGGKSWLLRRLIEQAFGKVRIIVFDPEGELVTLAESFDFTVCAPDSEVAPISPTNGAAVARALYLSRRSAIISLSEFDGLEEMQKFVADFCRELLRMPQEHWHHVLLCFEEGQLLAPQLDKAESKKPLIDLARRGRKRGMCPVFAAQRLSELSKGVAGMLENKLIGLTTLDLDIDRAAEMLGMRPPVARQVLRRLDGGHFIPFGPALGYDLAETTVGPVITRHGLLKAFTGVAAEPSLSHDALAEQLRGMHRPQGPVDVAEQAQPHLCAACRGRTVWAFDADTPRPEGRLDAVARVERAFATAEAVLDGTDVADLAEAHGVTDQAARNWLHQALSGLDLRRLGLRGERVRVDQLRACAARVRPALAKQKSRAINAARRAIANN